MRVGFPEPDMGTVEIYPSGKVVVSSAASEKAAKRSMETVSRAFREAGCAPRDNVTTAENTFEIKNVTAKYEKEGSTLEIHLGGTYESLVSSFGSAWVTYEPERKIASLKLWSKNHNEVTFRFNTKTITVWGKELEEMESLFVHEVFDRVKWMPAPTPEPTPAGADTPQSAPNRCTRTALEHAVKAIVADSLPPKASGGYLSRHSQIQQWLQQTHPEIPALPDYDPLWGSPGRQAQKARACRAWAGKPYEAFWDNHMVPALDGSPVKEVSWSVPSASAPTPTAAASAMGAPAEVASSEIETDHLQRLQAVVEELAREFRVELQKTTKIVDIS